MIDRLCEWAVHARCRQRDRYLTRLQAARVVDQDNGRTGGLSPPITCEHPSIRVRCCQLNGKCYFNRVQQTGQNRARGGARKRTTRTVTALLEGTDDRWCLTEEHAVGGLNPSFIYTNWRWAVYQYIDHQWTTQSQLIYCIYLLYGTN